MCKAEVNKEINQKTCALRWFLYNLYTINFYGPISVATWSVVAHLLGLWVWFLPEAWMSVSFECCVLSGGGICNGPIHRPEMYQWICVCHWVRSSAAISRQKRGQPKKDRKFLGVSSYRHLHLATQVFNRLTHTAKHTCPESDVNL
jgi:hypothetical protein